ncbi:MAG: bifunctional proline dehydrogenase/L-glutamate gamma-semialdehyde dehydrogenase PutA [Alphaproteobacteria bacterium]|nr:MAG: bifunctional proline dehydrogenase/L-glutamate gamma-semialdehyde dehydrogenase PutA [Alphaproteobacteria bacterium]
MNETPLKSSISAASAPAHGRERARARDGRPSSPASCEEARQRLRMAIWRPEEEAVADLIAAVPLSVADRARVRDQAIRIIETSRTMRDEQGTLDAFLHEFGLTNEEGVALMCLAEALLRIPDPETQDMLIAEKISLGDWKSHLGNTENLFVNAGVWALMLTGRVVRLDDEVEADPTRLVRRLVRRAGEPVIRRAVNQAMRIMGRQFVFGRSMKEALARRARQPVERRLMSFDMLGEGARTAAAADRYFRLYHESIAAVGEAAAGEGERPEERSSVSIKLSALHPRYEDVQWARLEAEMLPRLKELARDACRFGIQLTIDAEEAARLDVSLRLFEALARDPDFEDWNGLGLAVQAYQKRAPFLLDWLLLLARETGRRIPVRLVKGAYWDSEIKHAQELGVPDFPVWTRKSATDACYLVCARRLLDEPDAFYPQFATHNAHTVAAIDTMAEAEADFEFQRLHGMGTVLYDAAARTLAERRRLRTYAPVGAHRDLLPYLVRRLLENGANSSFVNRFLDAGTPAADLARDPFALLDEASPKRHPRIAPPPALYGPRRRNSRGIDLQNPAEREPLLAALAPLADKQVEAAGLIAGKEAGGDPIAVHAPADHRRMVGTARPAGSQEIETALATAAAAWRDWNALGGHHRAGILRAMADQLEAHRTRLVHLIVHEAGRTLSDAISEVREAVDFCRYYALEAEDKFGGPMRLPGPTGERNELMLTGRGVFCCISPWNFPLAIFTGQIAAALAAGNAVIAKPAEQTPLVAHAAVRLFHEAGVPEEVLHLLLGTGPEVAAPIVADPRIAGVAFTGSTETAWAINETLARRGGPIVPLIAETGGFNAMVVDSTALAEQVADDVMTSAFSSAGQRCSALRLLMVQDEVADEMIEMILGAMRERRVGLPENPATDIGPVIDKEALDRLAGHLLRLRRDARLLGSGETTAETAHGTFLAPHVFEIGDLRPLSCGEVFGPVLHVLRWKGEELPDLMHRLRETGYGLTFGIHTRLERRWEWLFTESIAGNVYINRNMIGAVVGVQPFGGTGLSGTGPKAGGPHTLLRYATERVKTLNTAAIGGNTELFNLGEE